MLLQIRDFIQRERVVSTQQLAREFDVDEPALQPMLDVWVRHVVIQACHKEKVCQGSCSRCSVKLPVYYQFIV